jgi:hypothetical protein
MVSSSFARSLSKRHAAAGCFLQVFETSSAPVAAYSLKKAENRWPAAGV